VRLYQVPIATIAKLTGLSFVKVDESVEEAVRVLGEGGAAIEDGDDIEW
jgi:hypothetical protein